jgi:hypothetical protein
MAGVVQFKRIDGFPNPLYEIRIFYPRKGEPDTLLLEPQELRDLLHQIKKTERAAFLQEVKA